MKSALILSLCATVALSKPLLPRAYETVWDMTAVTKTVVEDAAQETDATRRIGDWKDWRQISGRPDSDDTDPAYADSSSSKSKSASTTSKSVAAASSSVAAAAVVPVEAAYTKTSGRWGSQDRSSTWAASSAAAATSAAASSSSGSQNLGTYEAPIVEAHNVHRSNHSVPDLVWDSELASVAAQIAASCVYAHDTSKGKDKFPNGYGQNIGAGTKPEDVNGMITNAMYNGEINFYPLPYGREPDMGNFEKWGHYSQIVWKSTTSVGCATQYCPGGLTNANGGGISPYFTVCNYSPPGNFGGMYAANVLQPGGGATVTV